MIGLDSLLKLINIYIYIYIYILASPNPIKCIIDKFTSTNIHKIKRSNGMPKTYILTQIDS